VDLSGRDTTWAPNAATGYKVEQWSEGNTFNQVTTAPAGATSIAIGGLTPLTKYYFRIRGFNGLGDSAYSNVASATTTNQVAVLDFSGGFPRSTRHPAPNRSAAAHDHPAREPTNA